MQGWRREKNILKRQSKIFYKRAGIWEEESEKLMREGWWNTLSSLLSIAHFCLCRLWLHILPLDNALTWNKLGLHPSSIFPCLCNVDKPFSNYRAQFSYLQNGDISRTCLISCLLRLNENINEMLSTVHDSY